jgi:hypothetical protein
MNIRVFTFVTILTYAAASFCSNAAYSCSPVKVPPITNFVRSASPGNVVFFGVVESVNVRNISKYSSVTEVMFATSRWFVGSPTKKLSVLLSGERSIEKDGIPLPTSCENTGLSLAHTNEHWLVFGELIDGKVMAQPGMSMKFAEGKIPSWVVKQLVPPHG